VERSVEASAAFLPAIVKADASISCAVCGMHLPATRDSYARGVATKVAEARGPASPQDRTTGVAEGVCGGPHFRVVDKLAEGVPTPPACSVVAVAVAAVGRIRGRMEAEQIAPIGGVRARPSSRAQTAASPATNPAALIAASKPPSRVLISLSSYA